MTTASLSEADLDEVSRRVATLLSRSSVANLRSKIAFQKSRSLSVRFREEVPLMGLGDAIKSKHRVAKILWTLVFFICVAATSYFLYKILDEYLTNPTATKVKMTHQDEYSFPPLVLCVDTWLHAEKAFKLGLTKEALHYGLSYLIEAPKLWRDSGHECMSKMAHNEFERIYYEKKFTDLLDFFNYISLHAVSNYSDTGDFNELKFSCYGCKYKTLPKRIFDHNMCYKIDMANIDGKERQSYGFNQFFIRVPDLSLGLAQRKTYWRLYVNPLMTKMTPAVPFVSVEKGHTHMVRITSERYRVINKPKEPCVAKNNSKNANYSVLGCTADCVAQEVYATFNCRIFNLDTDYQRPLYEYCNTYEMKNWNPAAGITARKKTEIIAAREKCLESCIAECEIWKYETVIDAHSSAQLQQEAMNDNLTERNVSAAKIYFTNGDVLADGVLVFTEVYTYSFETLLGNVGGTCGIWIGVNILTLMQLLSFCSKYCVARKARRLTMKPKKKASGCDNIPGPARESF